MKRIFLIAAIIACAGARRSSAADITTQPAAPRSEISNLRRLGDVQAAQKAQSKLTDEQRKKLQESSQTLRKEQSAIYEKLRAARQQLEQAAQAENFDEQTIRAKAAVVGQLEGDLAIVRAKHYQEIRAFMPKQAGPVTAAKAGVVLTNAPATLPHQASQPAK